MMIHMLSAWSKDYKRLARLTYPGKEHYAKKWGHGCSFLFHEDGNKTAWERPKFWLKRLEEISEGEWLWFTGCDVLITNPSINIKDYADEHFDLIVANDCNCAQSDSFLMKSNDKTKAFLKRVIGEEFSGNFRNEQEAFTVFLSKFSTYEDFFNHVGFRYRTVELHCRLFDALNQTEVRVKLVSQKYFNTYHADHLLHGLPTDGARWEPTDLVLHMCCKSLEYRIANLPRYIPREHCGLFSRI